MEIGEIKRRIKIHETLLERITIPRIEGLEIFINSADFKELANSNIKIKVNQFLCDHHLTYEEAKEQSIEGQVVRRFYWEQRQLSELKKSLIKEIDNDIEKLIKLKNLQ